MRTRHFRIQEHPGYGEVGLSPLWMGDHQADPLTGMGAAHDILEHGAKDTVEWQGLGGTVYVRGLTGHFQRRIGNPSPIENIGAEFDSLFRLWEGEPIPTPGRAMRLLRDEDAEEMIQAVVLEGCRQVNAEAAYADREDIAKAIAWTDTAQRARMVEWMRLGYRACQSRWRTVDAYMLSETFRAIESHVDTFLKHEGREYEGGVYVLSFEVETATCNGYIQEE